MTRQPIAISPLFAGGVLGLGSALIQAYFKVIPPVAYGMCMVCHPKDLVNWVVDKLFHADWSYSLASTNLPVLTVVGVILGAFVAAYQHGELSLRSARQPVFYFCCGFLMINFGLALGSCPIRVVLLGAYGSLTGLVAWACVIAGVATGIWTMRASARRSVARRAVT